ncbi:PCRF domain protein [Mycobacterium kansasii]|uniref:PCRF domain protein n=1 Tax=Mycobacterium kansasii TaxID=1768 RepID=A0A1V3XHW4_MYCKA|nr:PCRF domain protein [Mycobacterium kansasii]
MTQPVHTIDVLLAEHADLEHALSDPELHSNPGAARKAGRRFALLAPIVATHRKLVAAREDLETARELAASDDSFVAEAAELEARVAELDAQLTDMLAPRDPHDADDIVLEVKSGEGGEESALFAADLARMYIRYAERRGWTVTVLDETTSDLGGYKDATLAIASKGDSVDGVWSRMKFEGGVHRVQRVPVTESQGRVHTSAAGVLVYPEPEEVGEVQIDESDLRIDVYRSSGKGGQGSTPPTPRCGSPIYPPGSSSPAKTNDPSCRTRPAPCRCWPPGCSQWPRSRHWPTLLRIGPARSARWTAASASAPITSRRTGSPITESVTRHTISIRFWMATWMRCSTHSLPRTSRPGYNGHDLAAPRDRFGCGPAGRSRDRLRALGCRAVGCSSDGHRARFACRA